MGEVYLGEQVSLGRKVAIKVLHADLMMHRSMIERFKREARLLSALDHPAVVRIIDFGETQVGACLVMEYVEGENLYDMIQTGAMEPGRALPLLYQLAEGLAAIHDKGIIHRDLKPENVLLTRGPRGEQARLLDFGIARMVEQDADSGLSQVGLVVGTPEYLSPEQAVGAPVDTRSDVYSFGVLAYRVLSGQLPFRGPGATQYVAQHASAPPLPLIEAAPTLAGHPALVALVMQLLRKDPANRLPHANALVEALGAVAAESPGLAPSLALAASAPTTNFPGAPAAAAPPSSGTVAFAEPAPPPVPSPPSGTSVFAAPSDPEPVPSAPGLSAPGRSSSQAPTRVSPGRQHGDPALPPSRAATLPSVGAPGAVRTVPPVRVQTSTGTGTTPAGKPQNLTVMVVHVPGYTERTSRQTHEQNARMQETLDGLLPPPVRDFGGRRVYQRGESMLAVFPSPTQAVLCGMALQDRLWRHHQRCPPEEQLPLRICLHTGEVLVTRDTVLGEPMEVLKAVEGVAEAGEVVFTGSVNLARNRVEGDCEPCGSVPMPGSGEPLPLFRSRRSPEGLPFGGQDEAHLHGTHVSLLVRALRPVSAAQATVVWAARATAKQAGAQLRTHPRRTVGLGLGLLAVLGLGTAWVVRGSDPVYQVRGLVEAGKLDEAMDRIKALPPEVKKDDGVRQLRARVLHKWRGHDNEFLALKEIDPDARGALEDAVLDGLAEDFGAREDKTEPSALMATLSKERMRARYEELARQEFSPQQWGALRYLEAMQATSGLDLVNLYSRALESKDCTIRVRAVQRLAGLGSVEAVPALEQLSKQPRARGVKNCGQDEAKDAVETLTKK